MLSVAQKKDKSGLWILAIIVVAMFCAGLYQVRYRLFTEDRVKAALIAQLQEKQRAQGSDAYLSNSNEAQDLATLQKQDTDGDGLTDFEEQYVDATSPYLADSDSDGVSDSAELTAGTNPNCPEGQSCSQVRTNADAGLTADAEAAFASLSSSQVNALRTQVTPDQIRSQLLEAGADKATIDALSDAQLMELVDETLNDATNTDPKAAIDAQVEAIRSMTIDEKKAMLAEVGISNKTIESLSNDQINALVEQAVQDAYKSVTATNVATTNSSNTNSK